MAVALYSLSLSAKHRASAHFSFNWRGAAQRVMSLAHSRIREREREREEEKEEEEAGKPYTHLLNGIPDAMPPGREYTYTRSRERRGRGGGGESIFGGSPCCSHKHTQQTLLLRISLDSCVLWYHHTREARGEERRLFPIPLLPRPFPLAYGLLPFQ